MGFKQFNADLQVAKDANVDGIGNLRAGESDGALAFSFAHDKLHSPLEIQALIPNIDDYPTSSTLMLFTTSDDVDAGLVSFIEHAPPKLARKPIIDAIISISDGLTAVLDGDEPAFNSSLDADGDEEMSSAEMSEFDDNCVGYDDDDEFEEDDYAFGLGPPPMIAQPRVPSTSSTSHSDQKERQRRELSLAVEAGFSVGVMGTQEGQLGQFLTLALAVSRLGLSDDIIALWDLQPSDYVVLLLAFRSGYPSLGEFTSLQAHQTAYQARLGRCRAAKPSIDSVRAAFTGTNSEPDDEECHFFPMHLFNSIITLLHGDFPKLLGTRRKYGISTDAAQDILLRKSNGSHVRLSNHTDSEELLAAEVIHNVTESVASNLPWALRQDHALEPEANFSIPLVMMQFALRRLVQSGRYCANCHQRVEAGFEGMKPYVCNRLLCLDQYFSLGIGPGIEHEIIHSPNVVDLLISFFYSAAYNKTLREFPIGLGLMSIHLESLMSCPDYIEGEASFETRRIEKCTIGLGLKKGDRILLAMQSGNMYFDRPLFLSGSRKHLCSITSINEKGFNFEILSSWSGLSTFPLSKEQIEAFSVKNSETGLTKVFVLKYSNHFDDIEDINSRHLALTILASGIPSVPEMRNYLVENPGKRLSSWGKLDHQTHKLIHWIVSSNRSLIVQDNAGLEASLGDDIVPPIKVAGIPKDWMQFRFLQGSPEKELRFQAELDTIFADQLAADEKPIPTLFGWHGSHLGNWHSIIRTSLDALKTSHGRSFGDGVYMSRYFDVARGYTRSDNTSEPDISTWPSSQLKIKSAIVCCEVVNCPERFVRTDPHYVVSNTEWIQCRYLFVQALGTPETRDKTAAEAPTRSSAGLGLGYLRQQENRTLVGGASEMYSFKIPCSAVPAGRLKQFPWLVENAEGGEEERTVSAVETKDMIVVDQKFEGEDIDGILDASDEGFDEGH